MKKEKAILQTTTEIEKKSKNQGRSILQQTSCQSSLLLTFEKTSYVKYY